MTARPDMPRQSLPVKFGSFVALAGLGGLFGYAMTRFAELKDQPWPDSLATSMAVALLTIAVLAAAGLVVRRQSVPRGCGVLQVVVFLLAGVMFLLPMFGPAFAAPNVIFAGVVVLLAIQSVTNLLLWRRADEMLRQVMAETSALAFWALQTALFLYAAAERLGLVGTISGWGLMGILMGVYLVASIIAAARRGIH